MPNTVISLDYNKCRPDLCNSGSCLAVPACPLKLLQQEEDFSFPMANSTLCKGCARCISACPYEALKLI